MKIIEITLFLLSFTLIVQSFNPLIEWSCESYAIHANIKTDSKFGGIAYATGYRSKCFVYGNNSKLSDLVIPMTPDENNPCGVKINEDTDIYWVQIEVHKQVVLSSAKDRTFNVTCKKRPNYFEYNDTTMFENENTVLSALKVYFNVLSNHDSYFSMIDTVAYVKHGESYLIHISLDHAIYGNKFRVTNCFAQSEGLFAELIDSNGCSVNDEIENFIYENGYTTAMIPSFFRILEYKILKLECKISICYGSFECRPQCEKSSVNLNQSAVTVYSEITSKTIHVLDENSNIEFCENNNFVLYCMIAGLILIIFVCASVMTLFYLKYRKQKDFFTNFLWPFHYYRNSALDGTNAPKPESRRPSISRFVDTLRRSSAVSSTPATPPTSTFYLMEMRVVPQNFHQFKLSSLPDVENSNSIDEKVDNDIAVNETEEDETVATF